MSKNSKTAIFFVKCFTNIMWSSSKKNQTKVMMKERMTIGISIEWTHFLTIIIIKGSIFILSTSTVSVYCRCSCCCCTFIASFTFSMILMYTICYPEFPLFFFFLIFCSSLFLTMLVQMNNFSGISWYEHSMYVCNNNNRLYITILFNGI